MSYGIEIYAADGTLQANSEMICWFCRKTGTGTTTFRTVGNTPTSTLTVDVTGMNNPIVAIRMAGYNVAKAGNSTYITDAPIGTSYTYYVFDFAVSLPENSGGYGIEIFNATGQRVFNSNFFPMQVLNMLTTGDNSVTHTGKTLAIANASMGGYATRGDVYCYDGGGPAFWDGSYCEFLGLINDCKLYGGILSNSFQTATTSTASFDDVTISIGNSDNYVVPPDWNTPSKLLVIDVSNIPVPRTFY